MRRNRGVVYTPKECEVCDNEYVPTSGRQLVCDAEPCRAELARRRVERKCDFRRERTGRPTEKSCEWDGCEVVFPLSATGKLPQYCPDHRKESAAPRAKEAMAKWRQKTIDVECRYQGCENLQHPSAQGWCYFHYPILSMHGLSADEWWGFYERQGGVCPICLEQLFDGRTIAVDHDHTLAPGPRHDLEHVRGLLHANPCNNVVLGGIETAIANGWFERSLRFIHFEYPPSESN